MGTDQASRMHKLVLVTMATILAMGTKAEGSVSDTSYLHTALGITCKKCLPGSYRINHCTLVDSQAECSPCQEGTFQTDHTIAESCESCRLSCKTRREDLMPNCSATSNNICVCKSGYFRFAGQDGLCVKHEPCRPGMGVKEIGTPDSNTACEMCKTGFFSPNESLTQICQPCSNCREGYKPKHPCPLDSDTKCVPENDDEMLPVILGIVGGVIFLLVVLVAVMCVCARRGHGLRLFQQLCPQQNTSKYDSENPEKTPLSEIEKPSNSHNGMTNGDVVDKPDNGFVTEDLPGVVPDKTLVNLSYDLIDVEWPFFFRDLIGESADQLINESRIDNNGVREQIYKLLKKWKHMKKDEATLNEILKALENSGKNYLAKKYSQSITTDV